ncbi:hypothetical protein TRFO_40248 [Tritrichomonas foetus]|uniref:Uncharacterized protein n=1 Tax=Tritrichomonas foetus TaxID=1144522 RepID=A0A1J4J743_9EUKA|nr:hypothetical protein TRFO_40248 [Tritrichomonas foetus]|eukprot:OHS93475.1 hypothetical protein TRFO_40248 [Tritrichomonas foetus]
MSDAEPPVQTPVKTPYTPSKKFGKGSKTPNTGLRPKYQNRADLIDDEEEDDFDNSDEGDFSKSILPEHEKDENYSKRSTIQGRRDKKYSGIKKTLDKFKIPAIAHNATDYKRYFLDIIINGNYRIKYVAKFATRDGAEEYCESHIDKDGLPMYRLLPTNEKDPVGNDITDLNGDQVDDIVLIDRNCNPAIINGYKLVRASPYKKVWAATYKTKAERKAIPFNLWINTHMGKTNEVDWSTGKYKFKEPIENMKKLMETYKDHGLPKPRVNKRATVKGHFSAAFAKVWRIFWRINESYATLRKIASYLKISNAYYITKIEIIALKNATKTDYSGKFVAYMNRKNADKNFRQNITVWLAENTLKGFVDMVNQNLDEDGDPRKVEEATDDEGNKFDVAVYSEEFNKCLRNLEIIIINWGFSSLHKKGLTKIIDEIDSGFITEEKFNKYKTDFDKNLIDGIDSRLNGYKAYIEASREHRADIKKKANKYQIEYKP